MTYKEDLPKGQITSHDGQSKLQSKSSQKKPKQADSDVPHGLKIHNAHVQFVNNLINDSEIDIKEYEASWYETGDEERNLIHHISDRLKAKQIMAPPKALELVERLVLDEPELFTQADQNDHVPLLRFARYNAEILFRVIDLVIPDSVLKSTKAECDESGRTCPLSSVQKSRLQQCLKKQHNSGRLASPDDTQQHEQVDRPDATQATQTETGDMDTENSCLHDQIDIHQLEEKNWKLRKTLSSALSPESQEVPYLQWLIVGPKFDPGPKNDVQLIPLDSFKCLLQLSPDTIFESANQEGYSPLQMAIRLYDEQSLDYDHLFSAIQALVYRFPSSIYFKAEAKKDEGKTAYRLLKVLKEVKSKSNMESRSRTEDLLKRVCISLPKDWDAMKKFLYWDAKSVRRVCLNLSGESLMLDKSYISTIEKQSGMHFETVLSFVKLPNWKPQDWKPPNQDVASRHIGEVGSTVAEDKDPYTAVFQWLWDSGVRKIFTVEVIDDGPNPHTNAAIRQSLRGVNAKTQLLQDFEVEVWKWKKFDICSETIFNAAPMAGEVHLYSSGNTAVLRGWACSSGLPKLTNLQRLQIEISFRNANDKSDCEYYEQELKKTLAERCPRLQSEEIYVIYHDCQAPQASSDGEDQEKDREDDKKPSNPTPDANEWIDRLKPFKAFIRNVLSSEQTPPSVRVALLDDGAKLASLAGKQKGTSFRPDDEEYFVGHCSHGTQMARCIRDICPMAELYIARLDNSRPHEEFTTASACKALQWAMDMNADIISMSWTFKMKGSDEGEDEFLRLIKEAVHSHKFILFGSLPDKGPDADIDKYAPVGLDGVIKICSATIFGEKSKENLYAKTDFTLPGEEIKLAGETVSGSSFSTAYASGLGALVLYCLRVHMRLEDPCPIDEDLDSEDDRTKRLNKAKTVNGMKTIFKNLRGKSTDDHFKRDSFVRPYTILGDQFEDSKEGKLKAIRKIITQFLPAGEL